jgi:hypothetical protein
MPFALIHLPIRMHKPSSAMCEPLAEVTFILWPILLLMIWLHRIVIFLFHAVPLGPTPRSRSPHYLALLVLEVVWDETSDHPCHPNQRKTVPSISIPRLAQWQSN